MAKKLYTVTIPTSGYVMYEVAADSEEEAREILNTTPHKAKCIEEGGGDWADDGDWDIEESDA